MAPIHLLLPRTHNATDLPTSASQHGILAIQALRKQYNTIGLTILLVGILTSAFFWAIYIAIALYHDRQPERHLVRRLARLETDLAHIFRLGNSRALRERHGFTGWTIEEHVRRIILLAEDVEGERLVRVDANVDAPGRWQRGSWRWIWNRTWNWTWTRGRRIFGRG
jgi:hypothetical protein